MTIAKMTESVAAVMREIHRLKKDETNKHGGYKYVSVDDVKDHVRPLLGKHGLEITFSELEFSIETIQAKSGPSVCAKITYAIGLRHISGECGEAERLTVLLPYTGAQTTGAARSYAVKEYIKSRFLVSTGEKDMIEGGADADAYQPQEYSAMPSVAGTTGASKAASRAAYDTFVKAIRSTVTLKALGDWLKENVTEIDKLPQDWVEELRQEYSDRQSELKKALAA